MKTGITTVWLLLQYLLWFCCWGSYTCTSFYFKWECEYSM